MIPKEENHLTLTRKELAKPYQQKWNIDSNPSDGGHKLNWKIETRSKTKEN